MIPRCPLGDTFFTSRTEDWTTMAQTLGEFIRERRRDLGLTQEQLAERMVSEVRQAEIPRLEHGHVALPRRQRLEDIAQALEVSIGELLIRTGWMTEEALFLGARNGAHEDVPSLNEVEERALRTVAAVMESVAVVRVRIAEAMAALDQAESTVAAAVRTLNAERNTRGVIRSEAGLIDDWETAKVFIM